MNPIDHPESVMKPAGDLMPGASILRVLPPMAMPLMLCFALALPAAAADRLPNIVIVFADDLGYGDVGCFGATGYQTPHLDRLAQQGTRFTNFHVPQPVCSASRAGLLTGCYPNRIGIHGALGPGAKHGLNEDETTIAEVLKSRGYATGMAGKWHLGHHPQFLPVHHGFDEYFGLPYSNDMWPYHPEARKGTYPKLPLIEGDQVIDAEVTPDEQPNLTTWYAERAVKFIEKNKDRPFFFYLAHSMPHVPLFVSDKFKGKSERGVFGDVLMEIDWSVGQIMQTLDKHGLTDNTLVIFTSDNGPWLSYGEHAGSAGPLREGKGTCWEGGTREPCIMRWPGHIPAGAENGAMAMTIDLLPTIAGLVKADLPKQTIDGLDVWPLLAGEEGAKNPHEAYAFWYQNNQLQAIASGDGRWKLQLPHGYRTLAGRPGGKGGIPVKYDNRQIDEPELYDLEQDVGETRNVAAQHPEIVSQLLAAADKARGELGDSLTDRKASGARQPGQVANRK
jgi:arylsulfatase